MEEHFWINPLRLDSRSNIDGNIANREPPRRTRSLVRSPSTEAMIKEESICTFLRSAEVAMAHIEDVKAYLLDVQYPLLDPDSLASHQYEFLRVPEVIVTDSDNCLSEVLRYLQKYGVTFYQIMREMDEHGRNTEYYKLLKETREKIVRLLCDLQVTIEIFELRQFDNITYDMLPAHMKYRANAPTRCLRDYLVVRHYAHFLEFMLNQKENFMRLCG